MCRFQIPGIRLFLLNTFLNFGSQSGNTVGGYLYRQSSKPQGFPEACSCSLIQINYLFFLHKAEGSRLASCGAAFPILAAACLLKSA